MIRDIIINFLRFVFLVALQGIVINNLGLSNGMVVPFIYVLFILMLPFGIPGWLVMLLSLCMGFSIDAFTNTIGLHASACLFLAYLRTVVLKIIAPREGYDSVLKPNIQSMGGSWYASYVIPLVVAHHLWLFNLENFQFDFFFRTQLRVILSSIFSLGFIYLSQYLLFQVRERRR